MDGNGKDYFKLELSGHSLINVVKAAEDREGNNVSFPFYFSRVGSILERHVSPVVVVVMDIFF